MGDFNAGVKRGGWGTATLGDAGGDLGTRRKGTNLRCFYFNFIPGYKSTCPKWEKLENKMENREEK